MRGPVNVPESLDTTKGVISGSIRFKAGEAIDANSVIYFSGMDDAHPIGKKADADTAAEVGASLWFCKEALANNAYGTARRMGVLTSQNTAALSVGAPIWLSGTAGAVSHFRRGQARQIGEVLVSHASTGVILVAPQNYGKADAPVPSSRIVIREDFLLDAGGTLPPPLGKQDTSAAGSPTLDYVADAANGQYVMKLDTTNEVEAVTLYHVDQLVVPFNKKPRLEVRLKIEPDVTGGGGQFAAGDKLVIGLGSARNATLDSMVTNAWFLVGGAADHTLRAETDDGTTDNDDKSTGLAWVDNTFHTFVVDVQNRSDVRFYFDGADANNGFTFDADQVSANVQFFIELAKAAAANFDHRVTVDYYELSWDR